MADEPEVKAEPKRVRQGRSPAYPALNLKEAISKAKAMYEAEGRYAVPMPSAFASWGFSIKSSGGRTTRAALKYFGLIVVEGDSESGKVKLTEDALRILLDEREDQSEKMQIVRRLALTPTIHQTLHAKFPDGIKSNASVEHMLIFEEGYNKSAAAEVVSEFKETAEFAGLFKPDLKLVKDEATEALPKDVPDGELKAIPKVGDLVQSVIGGAYVFDAPTRIRAIQDGWVFVDASEAGTPLDQIEVIEKAKPDSGVNVAEPPRLPLPKSKEAEEPVIPGMRKARFVLSEGDVTITFPDNLSVDSVEDLDGYWQVFIKKARRDAK